MGAIFGAPELPKTAAKFGAGVLILVRQTLVHQ